MTGSAPPRERHRPVAVTAAVALLSAAWAATAVLAIAVLASGRHRTVLLRRLDEALGARAHGAPHYPGPMTQAGVYVLLLVAGALLVYAVPALLHREPGARPAVWIGVPLLTAEPLRRAVTALATAGDGRADVTVDLCTIGIAATALIAAALLALPAAGAHLGGRRPGGRRLNG
jgi:hypothetical protein